MCRILRHTIFCFAGKQKKIVLRHLFKNRKSIERTGDGSHEGSSYLGKKQSTLEEAAAYSGIGISKIRQMSDREDCEFVLWVGTKRLIKRRKFDEYIDMAYSV